MCIFRKHECTSFMTGTYSSPEVCLQVAMPICNSPASSSACLAWWQLHVIYMRLFVPRVPHRAHCSEQFQSLTYMQISSPQYPTEHLPAIIFCFSFTFSIPNMSPIVLLQYPNVQYSLYPSPYNCLSHLLPIWLPCHAPAWLWIWWIRFLLLPLKYNIII